jgi:hypothetical protein
MTSDNNLDPTGLGAVLWTGAIIAWVFFVVGAIYWTRNNTADKYDTPQSTSLRSTTGSDTTSIVRQ